MRAAFTSIRMLIREKRQKRRFASFGYAVDPLSVVIVHEMMHALDRKHSLVGRDYEICHYFAVHKEAELQSLIGKEKDKYEYYASIMAIAVLMDKKPPLAQELLEATFRAIDN